MTDDDVEAAALTLLQIDGKTTDNLIKWDANDYHILARDAIKALKTRGWQRVPDGYVVVPAEPTSQMIGSVTSWVLSGPSGNVALDAESCRGIYHTIIAARPTEGGGN